MLAIIVFGIMVGTRPLYKKVQAGLDTILGITRENHYWCQGNKGI